MSFLSDFENRIGSVFGAAPQGYAEPFSFKKLAKRAAKEMERETYEIDGVDTAPALYTVLVAPQDDSLMRPLYADLTAEVSDFVATQAQQKDYVFVGQPLVRFMVDPSLKPGKFAVFAENVDGNTLDQLRNEERAFLGGNSSVGGAAAQMPQQRNSRAAVQPEPQPEPDPLSVVRPVAAENATPEVLGDLAGTDAGLAVMPPDFVEAQGAIPVVSAAESTPMPVLPSSNGLPDLPVNGAIPTAAPVPMTQRRITPSLDAQLNGMGGRPSRNLQGTPRANMDATCILIDRQSGRSYRVEAPRAIIGRERSQADVVLRDPNVSRRHAEMTYDGHDWHIADLHSTNGTLVNDIDVDEVILRDGDLITIGLMDLQFREN